MNPPLNRADLIALCGRLPDSYEDYPFDDPNWTVMRHRTNRRSYALIFERQGRLWVNVKAEPAWGDFWKQTYPAVVPAYHMNKRHWIGIVLDGSMTADQIFDLIAESYRLTAPRRQIPLNWQTSRNFPGKPVFFCGKSCRNACANACGTL